MAKKKTTPVETSEQQQAPAPAPAPVPQPMPMPVSPDAVVDHRVKRFL